MALVTMWPPRRPLGACQAAGPRSGPWHRVRIPLMPGRASGEGSCISPRDRESDALRAAAHLDLAVDPVPQACYTGAALRKDALYTRR